MQKIFFCVSCLLIIFFCGCGNNTKATVDTEKDTIKEALAKPQGSRKNVLFFGNSLTAGYGLEDPKQAFPSVIQQKIDSLGLNYKVINGGLSGETTADGKNRINWLLQQPIDIFVLELGANDGLRGIPVSETEANLQSIIDQVKTKYPNVKIILTGMMVPPNMGAKYSGDFKEVFPRLAKKNDIRLVPFLLENVAGIRELNQGDGIHPTAKGAKIVAQNVWVVLKPML